MDILLDNPLAAMYGPYFLIVYGFTIFFTLIALAFAKSRLDQSDKLTLPPVPAQIDPFEIAYLRGGTNEVARSVIFSLMHKGWIEISNESSTSFIKPAKNSQNPRELNQIENLALNWLGSGREAKEVFDEKYGLIEQLGSYGLTFQTRLESRQMLVSQETKNALSKLKWLAAAVILGLGSYKIFAAFVHGNYNFVLIIIFAVAGLIIAKKAVKMPRLTKLGKAYLERLQLAFDNLKNQSQSGYLLSNKLKINPQQTIGQTSFAGVDPLLLSVGVFGSGILAGTVFDDYNKAFQRSQMTNGSGGSSCGSGCGSCSSDNSGGSSSDGGSSCGGGCGGCGGGCS
jgi:uncharacterized protein (TIGR04222 family)